MALESEIASLKGEMERLEKDLMVARENNASSQGELQQEVERLRQEIADLRRKTSVEFEDLRQRLTLEKEQELQ